jgi:hypothetical protein
MTLACNSGRTDDNTVNARWSRCSSKNKGKIDQGASRYKAGEMERWQASGCGGVLGVSLNRWLITEYTCFGKTSRYVIFLSNMSSLNRLMFNVPFLQKSRNRE